MDEHERSKTESKRRSETMAESMKTWKTTSDEEDEEPEPFKAGPPCKTPRDG